MQPVIQALCNVRVNRVSGDAGATAVNRDTGVYLGSLMAIVDAHVSSLSLSISLSCNINTSKGSSTMTFMSVIGIIARTHAECNT